MIAATEPADKASQQVFAQPRWTKESRAWQKLDRELAADHPARWIVAAIEGLIDVRPLFASYRAGGSDAIPPDLMLKMVLVEMWSKRQLPAEWFKDARDGNAAVAWAGMGLCPCLTSWYNFHDRVASFLPEWFRAVVQFAVEHEITTGRRGALDGTFVAANASRHHLLNEGRLESRCQDLERVCAEDEAVSAGTLAEVKEIPAMAETPPETEERPAVEETPTATQERPAVPRWMAKNPQTRRVQRQRYCVARERLDELHAINDRQRPNCRRPRKKVVVSATDPIAALGVDKDKVFRPLYNVQVLRDVDSPLTLAYGVFAQNHDRGMLGPMIRLARDEYRLPLDICLADGSYVTAVNLAYCEQEQLMIYGPWQEKDDSAKKPRQGRPVLFGKAAFRWLSEASEYECLEGHRLTHIGKETETQADGQIHIVHRYRCSPSDCMACARQASCTTSPARGRSLRRSEHQELIDAHCARMATEAGKAIYSLRKQTVELCYADLKGNRGLRILPRRGLLHASTHVGLNELVRNLMIVIRRLYAAPPPARPKCPC
jgi:hypothetical protein